MEQDVRLWKDPSDATTQMPYHGAQIENSRSIHCLLRGSEIYEPFAWVDWEYVHRTSDFRNHKWNVGYETILVHTRKLHMEHSSFGRSHTDGPMEKRLTSLRICNASKPYKATGSENLEILINVENFGYLSKTS